MEPERARQRLGRPRGVRPEPRRHRRPARTAPAIRSCRLAASRPALEVFAGTLAARALSWAEEAFPVFGLPRVVDSVPLGSVPMIRYERFTKFRMGACRP